MAYLILPRRRLCTPPTRIVDVDYSNSIARALAYVAIPGGAWDVHRPSASYQKAFVFGSSYQGFPSFNFSNGGTVAHNLTHDTAKKSLVFRVYATARIDYVGYAGYGYYTSSTDHSQFSAGFWAQDDKHHTSIRKSSSTGFTQRASYFRSFPYQGAWDCAADLSNTATSYNFYEQGPQYTGSYAQTPVGTWATDSRDVFYVPAVGTTQGVFYAYMFSRMLDRSEALSLHDNPWQLFVTNERRYFISEAGGGTVTSSAAGRDRAAGADTVTPIKTGVAAGRERASGSSTITVRKIGVATGRERLTGNNTVSITKLGTATGREIVVGSSSATQVSAGVITSQAVGREVVIGNSSVTVQRNVSGSGRTLSRGSSSATTTRLAVGSARIAARGSSTASVVVAGTVISSAIGRSSVRGSSTISAIKSSAVSGRLYTRGSTSIFVTRATSATGRSYGRGTNSAAPLGAAVYPDPSEVLLGVTYGPNGNDYTGTLVATSPTVADIVAGIVAAVVPVNVKKINDVAVVGTGTSGDLWRA